MSVVSIGPPTHLEDYKRYQTAENARTVASLAANLPPRLQYPIYKPAVPQPPWYKSSSERIMPDHPFSLEDAEFEPHHVPGYPN